MIMARKSMLCCGKYDLVFMDINMPVMDGNDATKLLKLKMNNGEIPQTPIVAVTAAKCEGGEEHEKFKDIGFDESGNIS